MYSASGCGVEGWRGAGGKRGNADALLAAPSNGSREAVPAAIDLPDARALRVNVPAAPSVSAALRRSRRFTLERFDERDQRALVGVAQTRLARLDRGELVRAEVVALVDDQVLALADGEHVVNQTFESGGDVRAGLELALRALEQVQQLLLVRFLLLGRQFGAEQIDVGDQANRHSLRKRTDLHRVVVAADEWKQAASEPDQRAKIIGNVPFGHVEIAVHRDAIDDADARPGLVREQGIFGAPFRP